MRCEGGQKRKSVVLLVMAAVLAVMLGLACAPGHAVAAPADDEGFSEGIALEAAFSVPAVHVTETEHGKIRILRYSGSVGRLVLVEIAVEPDSGYELETIKATTVDSGKDVELSYNPVRGVDEYTESFVFYVRGEDVQIDATFCEAMQRRVGIYTEPGSDDVDERLAISHQTTAPGETITVTYSPTDKYQLAKIALIPQHEIADSVFSNMGSGSLTFLPTRNNEVTCVMPGFAGPAMQGGHVADCERYLIVP